MLFFLGCILAGVAAQWVSGKCSGRNAQKAFRFAGWGFWLLLLYFVPIAIVPPLPVLNLINILLRLTPAAIAFILAGNAMLKEMRAQQRGEYTEKAL